MSGQDWVTFWDTKASSPTDFQATGRGLMDTPGFLFTVREIARILSLGSEDHVLDVGCGTGIIALSLSPWVGSIVGLDISPKMVARAQENSRGAGNIQFIQGSLLNIEKVQGEFTKVLAYSVLQYLENEEQVLQAFRSVARVLPKDGMALFAANPDPERRAVYLTRAFEDCSGTEEHQTILDIVEATLWLTPKRMVELAQKANLKAETLPLHERIWQHFYMFDLVLRRHV
jgi:SAM-dependent methyltransferase